MNKIQQRLLESYNDDTAFGAGEYSVKKAMGKMSSPWL
jgi:MATE family multidrug resistance protein